MISVRLANLPAVRRGHDRFIRDNEAMVAEVSELAGNLAVQHVQAYPEFKPRTGALQRATNYRVIRTSGGRILRIENPKEYAATIDTGSRAHKITAKNAPFLRFKIKGRWIRTKSVNHPGTKPYKFLFNATDAAYRSMGQRLNAGMKRLASRF